MYFNIIMATIFGIVAFYAAVRILKKRTEPSNEAEKALRKEQSQRRWFILVFFAALSVIAFSWDLIVYGNFGFGWGLVAFTLFAVVGFVYVFNKIRMATVIAALAVVTVFVAPALPQLFTQPVEASTAFVKIITPETPKDGATPALLSGAATVTEETPATIECGIQEDGSSIHLNSWSDLVSCIMDAPENERAAYIAAANDRSDLGLSWDDIQKYAEREKAEGIDSRSILAINVGDMSPEEIRAGAVEAAGDAAADLEIVRMDGYLNNSSSFHAGTIRNVSDGRSQIRVQLNPILAPYEQTVAAPHGVKMSSYKVDYNAKGGVLVECANFTGGTTPEPPAPPKPPTNPPTNPPTSPPPTTTPPTTPPPTCTPGPEKCEEDDRLEEDPVNPAPSPSGEPETEEPVEEDPAGTPSEDPPGSEVPDLPADDVDEGTGETPREEVPTKPEDVPADENDTPLEGDQDPDSGSSDLTPGTLVTPEFTAVPEAPVQDAPAPEEVVEAPAPAPAPEAPAPAPEAPAEEAPAIEAPAEEAPPTIAPEDLALGSFLGLGLLPLLKPKRRL